MAQRSPDYWDRVEDIFVDVLEAPVGDRPAVLDARCGRDPAMRAEVESLLAAHDRAPDRIHPVTMVDAASEPRIASGTTIGSFKLVERIGIGGMGTVHRATRADGDFSQDVAIKLMAASVRDAASLRRFKAERQILAALHHPHIVTLLDGGVTGDGLAWLAMEYVQGEPITDYCRARRLGLEERLRLFQQVCSAVHYAHRHLVVHRDLKPANILVTEDGVPKVLDFGVAKLVETGNVGSDATLTMFPGPMTPNYASPEQLRGLTVTTASDIYALGVLLYEMLTGVRPYETRGKPLDAVLALVLDGSGRRPSEAAPGDDGQPLYALRGDIDAVVGKAMRVEPEARYGSGEELANDVERVLSGRPVVAREPTLRYLTSKLLAKYRVPATVAAVVLAAVLASLGLALWQWRTATQERTRAMQRAMDTRALARALIVKIHDAVVPLPGSTPVRQMIIAEALAYLDKVATDAREDAAIQLEAARAYGQVADLQGNPGVANLGDRAGAVASFEKALTILRPLITAATPDPAHVAEYTDIAVRLASTLQRMEGGLGRSREVSRDVLEVAGRLAAMRPEDDQAQDLLASAHWNLAMALPPDEAEGHWLKTRDLYARYLADEPDKIKWAGSLALTESQLAAFYEANGSTAKARPHLERTVELADRVAAWVNRRPAASLSPELRSNVADMISISGNALLKLGDPARGIVYLQRTLELRRQLAVEDPRNVYVRTRIADNHASIAWAYDRLGQHADAVEHGRSAVRAFDGVPGEEIIVQPTLARALLRLAWSDFATGNSRDACASLERAERIYARLEREERLTAMDRQHRAEIRKRSAVCRS